MVDCGDNRDDMSYEIDMLTDVKESGVMKEEMVKDRGEM